MVQFIIITPTIGRDTLSRCLITMKHQVWQNYIHIVVGDGPQDKWVSNECTAYGAQYYETPIKEGYYGTTPRNYILGLLEQGTFGSYQYVLFLDDDNILLEPTLYNINKVIENYNSPPLIWHDILFTNKYKTEYYVMPKSGIPLVEGDWDSLNCIYRADVIHSLRWKCEYNHDLQFARAASEKANQKWVRCDGIGAVHCLSWDTFELIK